MMTIGTRMVSDGKTARQLFEELMANPTRNKFGFGEKLAIVNVDFQNAYTRDRRSSRPPMKPTRARSTCEPHLRTGARKRACRSSGHMSPIWTMLRRRACGARAPTRRIRCRTSNIPAERHAFDDRCVIDPSATRSITKRMPSAFFETPLASYLVWHKVDTVVVTGGSTSGCVRATAVDSLSHGYRTIVPIETCADKHESYHFANLTDLQIKYADVEPVQAVIDWLEAR
jgi:maleamate amidohydrolase